MVLYQLGSSILNWAPSLKPKPGCMVCTATSTAQEQPIKRIHRQSREHNVMQGRPGRELGEGGRGLCWSCPVSAHSTSILLSSIQNTPSLPPSQPHLCSAGCLCQLTTWLRLWCETRFINKAESKSGQEAQTDSDFRCLQQDKVQSWKLVWCKWLLAGILLIAQKQNIYSFVSNTKYFFSNSLGMWKTKISTGR